MFSERIEGESEAKHDPRPARAGAKGESYEHRDPRGPRAVVGAAESAEPRDAEPSPHRRELATAWRDAFRRRGAAAPEPQAPGAWLRPFGREHRGRSGDGGALARTHRARANRSARRVGTRGASLDDE